MEMIHDENAGESPVLPTPTQLPSTVDDSFLEKLKHRINLLRIRDNISSNNSTVLRDKSSQLNIGEDKRLSEGEVEEEEEDYMRLQKAAGLVEDHLKNPKKGAYDLARDHGYHPKQVYRYLNHESRLDGKKGRPTYFTLDEELILIQSLERLAQEQKCHIDGEFIKQIARGLWSLINGTEKEIPVFSKRWLKGLRSRHPNFQLRSVHVPAKAMKKWNCATEEYVLAALNSLYYNLYTHSADNQGWIRAATVFVMDETDVTMNSDSGGTRYYCINSKPPPVNLVKNDALPHTTCAVFCSLDGWVPCCPFIVKQNSPAQYESDVYTHRPRSRIIYNSSGSSEKSTPDGLHGSYYLAFEDFLDEVDMKYGDFATRQEKLIVIYDGASPHMDLPVIQDLASKRGVVLIKLAANLTGLIQICDHERLNGKLKGQVRTKKMDSTAMNGYKELPLFPRLALFENVVTDVYDFINVRRVSEELGMEFTTDGHYVRMTPATIKDAILLLSVRGKIHSSSFDRSQVLELRDRDFLDQQRIYRYLRETRQDLPTPLFLTSAERFKDFQQHITALSRGPRLNDSIVGRRGAIIRPVHQDPANKPGTTVEVTSPEYVEILRAQNEERRKAPARSLGSSKKRAIESEEETAHWKELQEAFVDIDPRDFYRRQHVKTFIRTGLEKDAAVQQIATLAKQLKKQKVADGDDE
jgi:hypothetical protein